MALLITNNAWGTLAAAVLATDTSFSLTSGQGARFPALGAGDWTYATLCDTSNNLEIVKVTARATDLFTVQRAVDNTLARPFASGSRVELRPVAAWIMDVTNALITQFEAGVTMTGPLNIAPGASLPLHALSKGNVDNNYIALTGNWQANLGYVPLGLDALTPNDVYLDWTGGTTVIATVDSTSLGTVWHSGNFAPSSYAPTSTQCAWGGGIWEYAANQLNVSYTVDSPGSPWLIEGFRTIGDLQYIYVRYEYLLNHS